MKTMLRIFALAAALSMAAACTTTPDERREESKKAYPNREWQRPPAHWSPP